MDASPASPAAAQSMARYCAQRALDDGTVHEVLKNFPSREEALAAIGPRVRDAAWQAFGHCWALRDALA